MKSHSEFNFQNHGPRTACGRNVGDALRVSSLWYPVMMFRYYWHRALLSSYSHFPIFAWYEVPVLVRVWTTHHVVLTEGMLLCVCYALSGTVLWPYSGMSCTDTAPGGGSVLPLARPSGGSEVSPRAGSDGQLHQQKTTR
eukprot:2048541-Rhodomonas_salina.1